MKNRFSLFLVASLLFCITGCGKEATGSEEKHPGVPGYYLEQIIEKEDEINTAIAAADGDCVSFVFFTDAHWGHNFRHSPALIKDIVANTPIKDVFFGGDVITTHSSDKKAMLDLGYEFKNSFDFLGNRFYCLYGNHDNNSDGQPNMTDLHLSDDEISSFLQSQMTNPNTTFGDKFNFYVDFPESDTRVIGVNTGCAYYEQFRVLLPNTVQFAIDALNSAPEGWHILIMGHLWCDLKTVDGVRKCYFQSFIKDVLKVFDDYNNRRSGIYSYKTSKQEYDFREASSHIDICIGGHNHRDATLYSEEGIPVVILPTDSQHTINSAKAVSGTVEEQSLSVIVLDYRNSEARFFRIGRGSEQVLNLVCQ